MATPSNKVTTAVGLKPAGVGIGVGAAVAAITTTEQPEATSEVADEVTESPVRPFFTTTEDAPPLAQQPSIRKLNAKTLAEQKAGRECISAYFPVGE